MDNFVRKYVKYTYDSLAGMAIMLANAIRVSFRSTVDIDEDQVSMSISNIKAFTNSPVSISIRNASEASISNDSGVLIKDESRLSIGDLTACSTAQKTSVPLSNSVSVSFGETCSCEAYNHVAVSINSTILCTIVSSIGRVTLLSMLSDVIQSLLDILVYHNNKHVGLYSSISDESPTITVIIKNTLWSNNGIYYNSYS